MARWVMVIDLAKCNGCERCVAGCSQGSQLPIGIAWRRIAHPEVEVDGVTRHLDVPISCMHCGNPPCRDVCPTGATHQRMDGIVDIDQDRCIGCGFCVVACPYQARSIVSPSAAKRSTWSQADSESSTARTFHGGTCTKCDMCRPKIEAGLEQGLIPGVDRAATPACVNACLWGAIQFGDADDPSSSVSRSLRQEDVFRIHEELGTDPSIYYRYSSSNALQVGASEATIQPPQCDA